MYHSEGPLSKDDPGPLWEDPPSGSLSTLMLVTFSSAYRNGVFLPHTPEELSGVKQHDQTKPFFSIDGGKQRFLGINQFAYKVFCFVFLVNSLEQFLEACSIEFLEPLFHFHLARSMFHTMRTTRGLYSLNLVVKLTLSCCSRFCSVSLSLLLFFVRCLKCSSHP